MTPQAIIGLADRNLLSPDLRKLWIKAQPNSGKDMVAQAENALRNRNRSGSLATILGILGVAFLITPVVWGNAYKAPSLLNLIMIVLAVSAWIGMLIFTYRFQHIPEWFAAESGTIGYELPRLLQLFKCTIEDLARESEASLKEKSRDLLVERAQEILSSERTHGYRIRNQNSDVRRDYVRLCTELDMTYDQLAMFALCADDRQFQIYFEEAERRLAQRDTKS